jgi:gliding motility-associated-like protein
VAFDNDGTVVSYRWTQQNGNTVALDNVNSETLVLSNLALGTYEFSVEVTDDDGAISTDEITVTVAEEGANYPPVVIAGSKKVISLTEGTTVVLNGSASDADGSIVSLAWSQENGPFPATLSGVSSATLNIQDLSIGTYTFRLTATDNENAVAFDETTVEVKQELDPPTVFAGNDTTLVLPNNLITLAGVATSVDDHISEYAWTQTGGSTVKMEGEYPEVVVGQLFPGIYEFTLRVADSRGVEATDDITVTVLDSESNAIGAALVFTPNGDPANEVWTIKNINMIQGCPITIFNALGMKVFESDEYLNDWNGTNNGQQLKEGDYYFVFKCSDKKTYSGAFRLVR